MSSDKWKLPPQDDKSEDESVPEDAPAPLIDVSSLQQKDDDVYSDDG